MITDTMAIFYRARILNYYRKNKKAKIWQPRTPNSETPLLRQGYGRQATPIY
jgi:hypothetical protein